MCTTFHRGGGRTGRHAALVATREQLRPGEFLFAFLDDIHVVCLPGQNWRHSRDLAGGNLLPCTSISRQSVHPEQLRTAAVARIQRIQASLGALQPEDTEERRVLLCALEKAKRQAQVPPLEKQILAPEEYVTLPERRSASCNTMPPLPRPGIPESRTRQRSRCSRCRRRRRSLAEIKGTTSPIRRCQFCHLRIPLEKWPVFSKWSWNCNASCSTMVSLWSHRGLVVQSPISPFRIRKREDYVPATEHEVLEWMVDRHEDMTAALIARNTTEAARISSLITDAT